MSNLDAMALRPPVGREQTRDQAAVTLFGPRFGAEQSRSPRPGISVECLRNAPNLHQRQKTRLVFSPVLRFAVGIEQLGSWSELWLMGIVNASNFFEEIGQVWMLGETGELSSAIEAHIDELFYLRSLEQAKKVFGSLSGETDGAKKNFHTS